MDRAKEVVVHEGEVRRFYGVEKRKACQSWLSKGQVVRRGRSDGRQPLQEVVLCRLEKWDCIWRGCDVKGLSFV